MPADLAAAAARALAEGASLRAVRRARLTLPSRDHEFVTRHALEDALRTADFQDAGRLIIVRSLRLKSLPPGATGPQIARALERAWQALAPSAVAFDAPGAEQAQIVHFRSVTAARLAWLQRFAQGEATTAWFWPRALPEAAAAPPAADAAPLLVPLLAALQAAAAPTLARQLRALPAAQAARLIAALPAARAEALWAGVIEPEPTPVAAEAAAPARAASVPRADGDVQSAATAAAVPAATTPGTASPPLPSALPDLPAAQLLPLLRAFAATDWRLQWFVAAAVREGTAPLAPRRVDALIAQAQRLAEGPSPAAQPPMAASMAVPMPPSMPPSAPAAAASAARAPVERIDSELPHRAPAGVATRAWRAAHAPWLDDSLATRCGGLLMLLNALQVLRYPAWLAAQVPAVRTAFTRALLGQVAQRLRMAANDPHWTVLALHDDERAALWAAPCAWTGFGWPRAFVPPAVLAPKPVAGAPLAEAAASLCCWRRALVRLLRRHAGLSLPQVVVRAAGVSVTPTHIDIVLPLAQADTALRRVGLDGDLGWVPWFGWIVSFHYVEGAPDGAG